MFPYFANEFLNYRQELYESFSKHLENPEAEVRSASIQAFTLLISVINTPKTMYFIELLKPLLKAVLSLSFNLYLLEEGLKSLRDLAETEPIYFRPRLFFCFSFTDILCKQDLQIRVKYLCLEFLTVLVERHSQLICDNKNAIPGICELFSIGIKETINCIDEDIEIDYKELILSLFKRIVDVIDEPMVDYILKNSEIILSTNCL